ncbi:hypothetical protein ACTG16_23210 [Aeromonas sp. 23P]|uniref:hypothetical protein n=1 Tax=Aeromonas sp. 23P TaxID=3452716 RepID=UPI003F7A6061|nr:hypothetical protein [Aeromonas veronii]
MNIKITFYFVAIRTKFEFERGDPEYEVIEGPFITEQLATAAKEANPTVFDDLEGKRLVVIETELAPSWVKEC